MNEVVIAVFLVLALCYLFGEWIALFFVVLVIGFVISVDIDSAYYETCTGADKSYIHCFYERVIKP